ncbi:hypothetical protein V6N13_036751 [Hibiscus sabdariffa]
MKSNNLRFFFKCHAMDSSHGRLTPFEKMSVTNKGQNNPVRHLTLLDIIQDDRSIKDKKSWKMFRDKLQLKRNGSAWTPSVHIPTSDVNVHSSRTRSLHCGPRRFNLPDTSHAEDRGELTRASDRPVAYSKMQLERRESVSRTNHDEHVDAAMPSDAPPSRSVKTQMVHHPSVQIRHAAMPSDAPPSRSVKTQMVHHPSVQIFTIKTGEDDDNDGSDDVYRCSRTEDGSESPIEALGERSMSAREVVAA